MGEHGKLLKPELSCPPYAVSRHAICLSQVNTESYEHSSHTNTSLQNTLPTMPFSKHLCLWPNTLPFHPVGNTQYSYIYFIFYMKKKVGDNRKKDSRSQFHKKLLYNRTNPGHHTLFLYVHKFVQEPDHLY